MREPFDVLAEGLVSQITQENRTAIELFSGSCGDGRKSFISLLQALVS